MSHHDECFVVFTPAPHDVVTAQPSLSVLNKFGIYCEGAVWVFCFAVSSLFALVVDCLLDLKGFGFKDFVLSPLGLYWSAAVGCLV